MPTQEERISALEQTMAEYIKETNENLTMTLGLIQRQSFDVKAINRHLDDFRKNIHETLDIRFDAANAHFELLQKHADKTDTRLDQVEATLSDHTTLLKQILDRLPEKP